MEYLGLSADFPLVYATTAERRTEWACHMGTSPVTLRPLCKNRAKKWYHSSGPTSPVRLPFCPGLVKTVLGL